MIKAEIIKRIKSIEKKVLEAEVPDMIMIYYDWQSKDWVADERGNRSNVKHFKHYKDYIVHPQFEGQIILDLIDCPTEYSGNLHSINMKNFRHEHNLLNCGISFEAISNTDDGILEQSFKVVVHEYV